MGSHMWLQRHPLTYALQTTSLVQSLCHVQEQGGFLVPTLVTYKMLVEEADTNGLPKDMLAKVGSLYEDGLDALGLAHSKGARRVYQKLGCLCCRSM